MSAGDQAEGLRRLFARRAPRVATVIACRPRVGRTTLVINLASALGRNGRAVLVVDGNRGTGNVADCLGLRPRYELAHALRAERPLADALARGPRGVTVLPAAQGLALLAAPQRLHGGALAEFARLLARAEVVVVDAAPGAVSDCVLPCDARRETVLATAAGTDDITGTYARIKELARREREAHVSVAACGVRQETGALTAIRNLSEVAARHLGLRVESLGVLCRDPVFTEAARAGKTVPELFGRSRAAAQLESMAARFEAACRDAVTPRRAGVAPAGASRAGVPA